MINDYYLYLNNGIYFITIICNKINIFDCGENSLDNKLFQNYEWINSG